MPVIDEKPRPRAILIGFEDQNEIDAIGKFFPTLKSVSSLSEVRQAEWDVLVVKGRDVAPDPHLHVIAFGRASVGYIECGEPPARVKAIKAAYGKESIASELFIPDDLSPDVSRLVSIDILPRLRAERLHRHLAVALEMPGFTTLNHPKSVKGVDFQLFVGTLEPQALAGCFLRQGKKSQAWLLPFLDLDVPAWVEVALRQWHKTNPDRFPVDLGWERASEWMTPVEADLARQINSIQNERYEALARWESMERELTAKLHAANLAADAGERLLLTEQSELLVGAVADAFRELGFQVQDMDAVWPANDRREDLRLSLPEKGDWLSICEVKGYYKSAKSGDLLKIERFRSRFFKELGRDPNRCLYVVNSFINDAPSGRKKPLHSNPDEVEVFAEDGGLVVGTVELFRLLMDVKRGRVDAQKARALLADSTGVFSWNPNDGENVS